MENNYWITSRVLPVALVLIMTGLGMGLKIDDFKRVAQAPRPVIIGLIAQMLILPAAAYVVCRTFGLGPEFSVGLMILSASPGGVAANLFSHFARGDVALNLSLTAANSVLAAVWLPLVTGLSLEHFLGHREDIGFQFHKALEVFVLVCIPVSLGMFIQKKQPNFARRMEPLIRKLSFALLVVIAVIAVMKERESLAANFVALGPAVVVFNLFSLWVGYNLPKWAKLDRAQSIAIAFEVGVHNSALAFYVALTLLKVFALAVPAALYSVSMFITAGALVAYLRRGARWAKI